MKKRIRHLITAGLALIPLAPLSAALDTHIVDAEAKWVVHLDVNALRESAIGKELVKQVTDAEAKKKPSPMRLNGKELLAALGRVTAYGTNLTQDPSKMDGALILEGTPELRKIAEAQVAAITKQSPQDISKLENLPFEAYLINHELFIALPSEPIVILSKSKTQLVRSHDVFAGKTKSLAQTEKSPLQALLADESGSFAFAAASIPQGNFFPEDAPQARLFQMTDSASFHCGEKADRTFVRADLHADAEALAEKLLKIAQGLTAMMSLSEPEDQLLAKLVNPASVNATREQNVVTLRLEWESDLLLQGFRESRKERESQSEQTSANVQNNFNRGPLPAVEGNVIAQWKADQKLGDYGISTKTLVSQTITNVTLNAGEIVVLTGKRNAGENARIDYVELTPAAGGLAHRIEAEDMTLNDYTVLETPHASGGKLIQLKNWQGTARFPFEGTPGLYTLTVRYTDEDDGVSTFFVSITKAQADKS